MSKLWICERKRITIGKEMNKQECLQQVIDILADNAHEMCAVERDSNDIILDVNMDGVQMVAREICNVFENKIENLREEINELENEMIQRELESL